MSDPINNQLMEIEILNNDIRASFRFMFTLLVLRVETAYMYQDQEVVHLDLYDIAEGKKFLSAFNELDFVTLDKRDHDKEYLSIIIKYYQSGVSAFREEYRYLSNWDPFMSLLNKYSIFLEHKPSRIDKKEDKVIAFPEHDKVKAEIEKLRVELSMLVLERDELVFVECKNIEMVYMLSVGGLEYKAFELNCAALRIKRKIELIQTKKNRQEKVVLSVIEEILDVEFAEYQVKLDEQIGKMNSALDRSKGRELSLLESRELKKLYIGIVKALHPDLHPDISSEKIKLFLNAVEAYKNSDLTGLRIITEMITENVLIEKHKDALVLLVKEKERLADLIKEIREDIIKIKSEYPYTMKSLIQDPDKIKEKKEELEGTIEEWKKALDLYKSKALDIMR